MKDYRELVPHMLLASTASAISENAQNDILEKINDKINNSAMEGDTCIFITDHLSEKTKNILIEYGYEITEETDEVKGYICRISWGE